MPCCEERPKRYIAKEVGEIEELRTGLVKLNDDPPASVYRCSECGQIWREEWVGVMHASTTVVYKEGVNPDPFVDVDGTGPKYPPPPAPRPKPGRVPQTISMTLALLIGLVTMPDGSAAVRVNWLLRSLLVGLLVTIGFVLPPPPRR